MAAVMQLSPDTVTMTDQLTNDRAILAGAERVLAGAGRVLAGLLVLALVVAYGLARLGVVALVLVLVLAGLDGLLPRKKEEAVAAIDSMDSLIAAAPVQPMTAPALHPWVELVEEAMPTTLGALRAMARDHGCRDWRKAGRPQLVASLFALI